MIHTTNIQRPHTHFQIRNERYRNLRWFLVILIEKINHYESKHTKIAITVRQHLERTT
jgi:hypothetical protein